MIDGGIMYCLFTANLANADAGMGAGGYLCSACNAKLGPPCS